MNNLARPPPRYYIWQAPALNQGAQLLYPFDPLQDSVARPCEAVLNLYNDWSLVDDLDGGVRRMRFRNTERLPREEKEEVAGYKTRLARSYLYPGLTNALNSSTSKAFSKPVTVENAPAEFEYLETNADDKGSDLTQFLRSVMRAGVKHGVAHVLVDFSKQANAANATKATDAANKPHPFFTLIEASRLVSWTETVLDDGTVGLTEIRFLEYRDVKDGKYGSTEQEFVRVIRLNDYEVWQNKAYQQRKFARDEDFEFYKDKPNRVQDFVMVDSGSFGPEGGFKTIPLVSFYTQRTGFMRGKPALMDLAETNLIHWQSASDQRNIMHVVRVPILFATGFTTQETSAGLTLAAGSFVSSNSPDANLHYVEHSGSAVDLGARDLETLEKHMEIMGVRPQVERSGDATATQSVINEGRANTDVQAWIEGLNTAAETMYAKAGEWSGVEMPETLEVKVFSDFAAGGATSDEILSLIAMRTAKPALITSETFLNETKRRGFFTDTFDVEAEAEAIEAEAQVAKEEAAEQMKMQLDAKAKSAPGEPGAVGAGTGAMPGKQTQVK